MATKDEADKLFDGSIPEIYDTVLVPLIFEPYAADMARRVGLLPISRILEVAAGTGVLTRALAASLPDPVSVVATDLNEAMLKHASQRGTPRPVDWRQADAMQLPFEAATFDAVVCQFGVMFFPEKAKAFTEVRRVLKPGGIFIFSVWDRIEENEFADVVTRALEPLFPKSPPRFLARTPHGYCDPEVIEGHLGSAGFTASPRFDTVIARSRAESSRIPAVAYCQGTPLRNEIAALDPARLGKATDVAAEAIASEFGSGPVDGKIQAVVVTVAR
jgi:ubiquinone/menaquinone biosynthesis C-methylase UbiE